MKTLTLFPPSPARVMIASFRNHRQRRRLAIDRWLLTPTSFPPLRHSLKPPSFFHSPYPFFLPPHLLSAHRILTRRGFLLASNKQHQENNTPILHNSILSIHSHSLPSGNTYPEVNRQVLPQRRERCHHSDLQSILLPIPPLPENHLGMAKAKRTTWTPSHQPMDGGRDRDSIGPKCPQRVYSMLYVLQRDYHPSDINMPE